MTFHHSAPRSLPSFARPDGSCLGRFPELEDEESVPSVPAETDETPAQPTEPMNPA